MINVSVICFTEKGLELGCRITEMSDADKYAFRLYAKYESFNAGLHKNVTAVTSGVREWTYEQQSEKNAIIFIGAMGIAVRAIAGGLESKLTDSPVIVADEMGCHVIPVVSGHVGGANEMAVSIADAINAVPVITTATDLEECFSVDLFAKENNLSVYNKNGIAKVSAKSLQGKPVRISIENYPPDEVEVIISKDKRMAENCDILLCPKKYAVGLGCRKDTSFEALNDFINRILAENGIDINDVGAVASIDIKAEEQGIIKLCSVYRIPFITYSAEMLKKAKGEFMESDFVKEKTGVGNVCERAAMLLTNNRGTIIRKKYCENGMTVAVAKME